MKKISILFILLLTLMLTGCSLAAADTGENGQDRLIGVFVTNEHLDLFDLESYLNDHASQLFSGNEVIIGNDDAQKYQNRIYAQIKEKILTGESGRTSKIEEFVFEGLEGIPYFAAYIPANEMQEGYLATQSDSAICDGKTHITTTDSGERIELSGTIYVAPGEYNQVIYINPVYQDAQHNVYLTAGGGLSCSGVENEGGFMSQKFETEVTETRNDKTQTFASCIELSVGVMLETQTVSVIEMTENHTPAGEISWSPDRIPDKIKISKDAAYLLVETHKITLQGESIIQRQILEKNDPDGIKTYQFGPNGVYTACNTQITWP